MMVHHPPRRHLNHTHVHRYYVSKIKYANVCYIMGCIMILYVTMDQLRISMKFFNRQNPMEYDTMILPILFPKNISNISVPINDTISSSSSSPSPSTPPPDYYIIFSTSCTEQQHWESYIFFYHCRKVQQPGQIIRIVSGCNTDNEMNQTLHFFRTHIQPMAIQSIQTFHIHFTPDYSRIRLSEGKYEYKYMNKPYGVRHWMEQALHVSWIPINDTAIHRNTSTATTATTTNLNRTMQISTPYNDMKHHHQLLDSIIILMDPDMILLKPITHDFSSDSSIQWAGGNTNIESYHKVVRHGNPISQQDGYLNNEWMKLNFTYITNDPSIQHPPHGDGPRYWNTGPPYLMTVLDTYKIVSVWTETAPRVLDVYPQLFAEMYGFIIATVQLQLPFRMTKSIVVSTTSATDREAWDYIDPIPDHKICHVPIQATTTTNNASINEKLPPLPIGLHYCGIYLLGKSMFSKYRIKKNIMNCDKGLMVVPSYDIYPNYNYKIYPPRADLKDADTYTEIQKPIPSTKQAKREAFMICGMISALNDALRYYKQQACGIENNNPPSNINETYTIHDDPTNY